MSVEAEFETRRPEDDDREAARRAAGEALQAGYEPLKPRVLGAVRRRLAASRLPYDASELDAHYNLAWHVVYQRSCSGRPPASVGGFLVEVVYRRTIDDFRRDGMRLVPAGDEPIGAAASEPDFVQRLYDAQRIGQLLEGIAARLDDRERRAASLCYLRGFTRAEAAEALAISPRRMEKVMDGVARKLATIVAEIDDDAWCEHNRSLIAAHALGLLDPEGPRARLARVHLRGCPTCRRHAGEVRAADGAAAAVRRLAWPRAQAS